MGLGFDWKNVAVAFIVRLLPLLMGWITSWFEKASNEEKVAMVNAVGEALKEANNKTKTA